MITERNFKEVLTLPCVVIEKPKLIFFRIPKVASTSIDRGYLKENFVTLNAKTNNRGYYNWLKTVTYEWFQEAFKFAFVRNPWDRFVSLYVYFTTYVPKSKGSPLAKRWEVNNEPVPSFEEFVNDFHKICERRQDIRNHNLPQHVFVNYEGEPFVDFVGRFERLRWDFEHIIRSQGLPYKRLDHRMKTDHEPYSTFYNDETLRKVSLICKKDAECFNYNFLKDKEADTSHSSIIYRMS